MVLLLPVHQCCAVQVCDATNADRSTVAGIIKNLTVFLNDYCCITTTKT
jgi:hypothetical protein